MLYIFAETVTPVQITWAAGLVTAVAVLWKRLQTTEERNNKALESAKKETAERLKRTEDALNARNESVIELTKQVSILQGKFELAEQLTPKIDSINQLTQQVLDHVTPDIYEDE